MNHYSENIKIFLRGNLKMQIEIDFSKRDRFKKISELIVEFCETNKQQTTKKEI